MKGTNPGAAMAAAIVDELARCGVEHACISPGSRSAPLAYALRDDPRIRVHVLIDERSSAFRALGLAKATGTPALVLTTSGTAAANLHPAVIEAHHSQTPLIVLTADRPPELRDTGAGQTIDQIKLFGGAVEWFCEVGVAEDLPSSNAYWRTIACRAWDMSKAGPVHLNVAFREPLVPSSEDLFQSDFGGREDGDPWTATSDSSPRVSEDVSEEEAGLLAAAIASAERGVVVAGFGRYDGAAAAALAESAGWPLIAEAVSGARLGRNAISTYDALLRHPASADRLSPDTVIRIGSLGTSRALPLWLSSASTHIQLGGWIDPSRSISRRMRSDVTSLCKMVSGMTGAPRGTEWLSAWQEAERSAREQIDAVLDGAALSEPAVARDLADAVPPSGLLVVGSSMPVRDLDWFMRTRTHDRAIRFVANRGANGIDGFVSTAVGSALGASSPTYALCGDLSFIHDQNGLVGAADVDLTFVVINNDGGGIFSFLPHARVPAAFEELFGTPHGLDLGALGSAYGCLHEVARDRAHFGEILRTPVNGLRIIEVRTNREENVAIHQRLWDAVAAGLDPRGSGL